MQKNTKSAKTERKTTKTVETTPGSQQPQEPQLVQKPQKPARFKSLHAFILYFREEDTCRRYLEQARWHGTPTCPDCRSTRFYRINQNKQLKCADCAKKYSVTAGTVFDSANIQLRHWFTVMYMLASDPLGISSIQVKKTVGYSQDSSWYMLQRIRYLCGLHEPAQLDPTRVVQMDETYIGGRDYYKHGRHKAKLKQGTGYVNKTPVFGLINGDGGDNLVLRYMAKQPDQETLKPVIVEYVHPDSTVLTDGFGGYAGLKQIYQDHRTVNHGRGEYVRYEEDMKVHTNTIENAFSNVKRTLTGRYRQVSKKYMQQYCYEAMFRMNTRKMRDEDKFDLLLSMLATKLTQKELAGTELESKLKQARQANRAIKK